MMAEINYPINQTAGGHFLKAYSLKIITPKRMTTYAPIDLYTSYKQSVKG